MFVENTDAGAGGEELHEEAEEGVNQVPGGGAPVLTMEYSNRFNNK